MDTHTEAAKPQKRTLNVIEAAHLVGVHPSTMKAWVRDGTVPSFKLGKRRLIPRHFIENLIEEAGCSVDGDDR